MEQFRHLLEQRTEKLVPTSLEDAEHALIVKYWLEDTMSAVFQNHEDRPSFSYIDKHHAVENPEGHLFTEVFVTTHQLREYFPPIPKDHFRFEIYRDMSGSNAVWYGDNLRSALVALLTLDAQFSVSENWDNFFKTRVGAKS
jgi:hypothetical protein